ncbi:MAG TPA: hypothetical protein VKE94_10095 [Gemmataceae bacterium]|nr:hypothetical protein [Gemmataceae bacterium]
MKRKTLMVSGTVLMFVALLPFLARPIYKSLILKKASPALIERTTKAVEKHPELKPDYDRAMEDGVLSYDEAKEILEKAGETVGPDE